MIGTSEGVSDAEDALLECDEDCGTMHVTSAMGADTGSARVVSLVLLYGFVVLVLGYLVI